MFTDRTGNNNFNSTFNNKQEIFKGIRNLTQLDIQTLSQFINKEIVKITPTTTQQNISPIHPTVTTPQNKITAFPQSTIQNTIKPSVTPEYS